MISIIICSRSEQMLGQLQKNIEVSIGVVFEIIAIDNSKGQYGICEAYNIGAEKSTYDMLCFMHEDLKFHSSDWGKVVLDILAKPSSGVLGVAGATYQVKGPTGWTGAEMSRVRMKVLHSTGKSVLQMDYWNPKSEKLSEVATVDGLWMCCRKKVWQEFPFDNKKFPKFHFYDIDFCTKIFPKYKILVTYDIDIEHFSTGTFEKEWLKTALNYYKLRNNYLPFGTETMSKKEAKQFELRVLHQFMLKLIKFDMSKKDILYCLTKCLSIDFWNKDTMWVVKQYMKR